jgi:2'-5' RNA ligase
VAGLDITSDAPTIRNHWWSRPGWYPGRLTYTWHLTFEAMPSLHRLAAAYQEALRPLSGLHPVPPQWLHLTMQSAGYTDEITAARLAASTAEVHHCLADLQPFELTFHRPHVLREAIVLPPEPVAPVHMLYERIRKALAAALGSDAVRNSPEQARGYRPHVSIAYSSINAPAAPYVEALGSVEPEPAVLTVRSAQLIEQERCLDPDWLYRWELVDTAALGHC